MHFFIFSYLLLVIAISIGALLYIGVAFFKDVKDKQWEWVAIHSITWHIVLFILHHFLDLMCKFVNS